MQNSYARFINMIVVITSKVTSVTKHYTIGVWVKSVRIVSLCDSGTSGVMLLALSLCSQKERAFRKQY